ncbi:hypothetical protein BGZ49_001043 [Haplosporangium sp. Z 27]|nr:hypothetical protein BGZ49_001043 [Haplosporangium sp. Z 27]
MLIEFVFNAIEVTTKFLTSSLVGLYPTSSTAPIPVVILPSARAMIAQTIKIPGLRGSTILTQEKSTTRNRELTLTPQEEIKLPSDHTSADDCLCTYCSTQVKPSKIPVLSKTEYELAELQSQCDSKDQHIAELLKAVQSLQGQVNVLNAKLLFLHDHHTTRPMRRRTLACNSYPLIPVTNNSGQDNAYQEQRQSTQQQKSGPGMLKSHSLTASANAKSPNTLELIEFFPEVQTNNHAKQRSTDLGPSLGLESLGEEDEVVSFLDLDSHPSPSLFPAHATYQSEFTRVPLLQSTAALNVDHAFNFDRSMMNVRCETGLERALRDIDEFEKEPEHRGEDQFDEHYYLDAYKTMDQQLYRRPNLPVSPSPQPMSSEIHKKHHRISLPIQSLMSKRISLGNSFRRKGRTAAA